MNAEQLAREIGEGESCACGCFDCGRNIYDLYVIAIDQAAWIRELERRLEVREKAGTLGALGSNLAVAAALTRAFRLGDRFGFDMGSDDEQRMAHEWKPNIRGRAAGSTCDDPSCSCREDYGW